MRFRLLLAVLLMSISVFADTSLIVIGKKNDVELVYPKHVIEGPDRKIYVFDMKDSYIKVFSPKGVLLKTIAGPGEGPGYIKRSDGVNFGFTTNKLIYITEYFHGHRWITLLNPDGSLHKTINPQLPNSIFGMERVFTLQDGSFLIEFAYNGLPQNKGKFFVISI